MRSDKKICLFISFFLAVGILSGVAITYLLVSLIVPSIQELSYGFNDAPIMCTTTQTFNASTCNKKSGAKYGPNFDCELRSCSEWCLSTTDFDFTQIMTMPRRNGTKIDFHNCEIVHDTNCSSYDVNKGRVYKCAKGECADLTGLYNCSKGRGVRFNPCKAIGPAYHCPDMETSHDVSSCNAYTCSEKLNGVQHCNAGQCRRVLNYANYEECERTCLNLELRGKNVIMFSNERILTANCSSTHSSNENIRNLNNNLQWKDVKKVLLLYCNYVTLTDDKNNTIHSGDCFNGTLDDADNIKKIYTYLGLRSHTHRLYKKESSWLLEPEESLRIMNDTMLKINAKGCVNTLKRECEVFLRSHAIDGADGRTQDRYECYYSNETSDFVLGKYNRDLIFTQILLGSIIPSCLLVIACVALFVSVKSVRIDEEGHMYVALLTNEDKDLGKAKHC